MIFPVPFMTGAYSFICSYSSTDTLLRRFQEMGVWNWRMGDSYWYGDYLACHPFPGVRIRIVDFPNSASDRWKYASDIRLSSPECITPMPVIDAAYRKFLAEIPALQIQEIDWFD